MARRTTTPTPPQRPQQTAQDKQRAIAKLERRVDDLNSFDPSKLTKRYNIAEVKNLEAGIDDALSQAFGHETVEYHRYSDAITLDQGPHQMGFGSYDPDNAQDGQRYHAEGKERSITILRGAIGALQEELTDMGEEISKSAPASDRRVRLDHNSEHYVGLVRALDRLTDAVRGLNDYEDLDLKEQRQIEISAGRDLLRPLYVRVQAIWAVLAAPLQWAMQQFAGKEIGHLADAAWKLFTTLFK